MDIFIWDCPVEQLYEKVLNSNTPLDQQTSNIKHPISVVNSLTGPSTVEEGNPLFQSFNFLPQDFLFCSSPLFWQRMANRTCVQQAHRFL